MRLKFLGTAAAEGVPALFCNCETCSYARRHKGKDLRKRSQALLDGKILIDFPADTYANTLKYNIDLSKVRHLLITHKHLDHIYSDEFEMIVDGFTNLPKGYEPLKVYCANDVYPLISKIQEKAPQNIEIKVMEPFKPFLIDDYKITALKAIHGSKDMNPYIYLIEKDKKGLLYALDTDVFPKESWDYLEKTKPQIGLVVFDCTNGTDEEMPYIGHMCFGKNRICKERLLKMGLINEKTKLYVTHFSHNWPILHKDLTKKGRKDGFVPSYDGLTVKF